MIALESFKVLRKLAVKSIHIEPRKVKATYCVEKHSGETTTFELFTPTTQLISVKKIRQMSTWLR